MIFSAIQNSKDRSEQGIENGQSTMGNKPFPIYGGGHWWPMAMATCKAMEGTNGTALHDRVVAQHQEERRKKGYVKRRGGGGGKKERMSVGVLTCTGL